MQVRVTVDDRVAEFEIDPREVVFIQWALGSEQTAEILSGMVTYRIVAALPDLRPADVDLPSVTAMVVERLLSEMEEGPSVDPEMIPMKINR